jgi:polysaccharide biosynthesis transport protein
VVGEENAQAATLRDYAVVVWRRKWLVAGAAVLLLAVSLAYSLTRTPLYKASAQLVYVSQLDLSNPLSAGSYVDPTVREVELSSVASVIASPSVVKNAEALASQSGTSPSHSVSAAPDASTGSTTGNTVTITAVSPDAQTSARVANAYAQAFTDYRKASQQEVVRRAEQVVQEKLDAFKTPASKLTGDYAILMQRLQDLQILEATATGSFSVLVPATAPSAPFSPKPVRNAIIGFVGGLVIGIGIVLLLAQFDTRVRTSEEAAAILRMPILGHVRKMSGKEVQAQPLVVLSGSHSHAAESIRKLRGSLEFADVDGDLKSFFITSSVQHEGKTLTVCNLALSLAATGSRVVLVDADLRRPQVHRYLNLPNGIGMSSVLTGRTELQTTLQSRSVGPRLATQVNSSGPDNSSNGGSRLHVLTSGPVPPNAPEIIASKAFAILIQELQASFDMVIVDAPALLAVGDATAIASVVNALVFLVDLTRARRPLLQEAELQLAQMPCRKLGLILLTSTPSRRHQHAYYSYEQPAEPVPNSKATTSRTRRSAV